MPTMSDAQCSGRAKVTRNAVEMLDASQDRLDGLDAACRPPGGHTGSNSLQTIQSEKQTK